MGVDYKQDVYEAENLSYYIKMLDRDIDKR